MQTPNKKNEPFLTVEKTDKHRYRANSDSGKRPWIISAAMSDARSNSGQKKTEIRAKNAALTNKSVKSKYT